MSIRFFFHGLVLLFFASTGVWLIYKELVPTSQGGFPAHIYSDMVAAMYWFGFLIYALLSSLFYKLLKGQSAKSLIIAHLFSIAVGMLGTAGIVTLGQHRAELGSSVSTTSSDY